MPQILHRSILLSETPFSALVSIIAASFAFTFTARTSASVAMPAAAIFSASSRSWRSSSLYSLASCSLPDSETVCQYTLSTSEMTDLYSVSYLDPARSPASAAALSAATIFPPMNTGCLNDTVPRNMLLMSRCRASFSSAPIALAGPATSVSDSFPRSFIISGLFMIMLPVSGSARRFPIPSANAPCSAFPAFVSFSDLSCPMRSMSRALYI